MRFSTETIEWAADLWLRLHGNRLARNAGYLVLAAVAAVSNIFQLIVAGIFKLAGQNIEIPDTPYWIVALFVVAAVVLLIVDRFAPVSSAPNPSDAQLFHKFEGLANANLLQFLREHSFGQSWARARLSAVEDLDADWRDGRHEFHDRKLQEALEKVLVQCRELENQMGLWSFPHRVQAGWQTVYTNVDEHRGVTPATQEKIQKMNATARRLLARINNLLKIGRGRIPPA